MLPAIIIMCIYRKTNRVPLSVTFLLKQISFIFYFCTSLKPLYVDEVCIAIAIFFGLHALKVGCQGAANWGESE